MPTGTQAKYTIAVPQRDNIGNQLVDLGQAVLHYIVNGPVQTVGAHIDRDKWHETDEAFDHVTVFAPDTPESDSHIKQIGHWVGDVANQWGTFIVKEGKNGVNTWMISNNKYQEGQPADSSVLLVDAS